MVLNPRHQRSPFGRGVCLGRGPLARFFAVRLRPTIGVYRVFFSGLLNFARVCPMQALSTRDAVYQQVCW